MPTRPVSRRAAVGGFGAGLAATALGGGALSHRRAYSLEPHHGVAVGLSAPGVRVLVEDADQLVPGTRVLHGRRWSTQLVAQEEEWRARCAPWTSAPLPGLLAPFADLLDRALRDLYVLTEAGGTTVAGWPAAWRYVWPRDTAHVVLAWHEVARPDLVRSALARLAELIGAQPLAARYRPEGGVPDERPDQLDGPGFVLWALAGTRGSWQGSPEDPVIADLAAHCTRQLLTAVAGRDLPPRGPDYWERPERMLTLGVAAPVIIGLEAAAGLLGGLGEGELAEQAEVAGSRVRPAVLERFGEVGWSRQIEGGPRDAAVAFALPPYGRALEDAVGPQLRQALHRATTEMTRSNGGLAPGGGWKGDGVAWTPETLLIARAEAAQGRHEVAGRWLSWIADHATSAGSIPEKVGWRGGAAGPAPLAWSSALAVSTIASLRVSLVAAPERGDTAGGDPPGFVPVRAALAH